MTTAAYALSTAATPRHQRGASLPPATGAVVTAAAARWRRRLESHAWLLLEPFLPGATLALLLVVLSLAYLREGFGSIRQHAFGPDAGKGAVNATTRRQWWHCPCVSALGCRCAQAAIGRLGHRAQQWVRAVCGGCR